MLRQGAKQGPEERFEREGRHYGLPALVLHWGFVALFIYGVIKQVDSVSQLEDAAFLRFEMVFAAVFLVLLAGRFAFMKARHVSALPADTPVWQQWAARMAHHGMYASLAGIALSGMMIGLIYGAGFTSGWLLEAAMELHGLTVLLAYWLIGIHVAAALYHRWLKDVVWSAMAPVWKEPPRCDR